MRTDAEAVEAFECFREAVTTVRRLRATYRLVGRIPVMIRPAITLHHEAFEELREPFERMCNADLELLPCRALPSEEGSKT